MSRRDGDLLDSFGWLFIFMETNQTNQKSRTNQYPATQATINQWRAIEMIRQQAQ